MPKPSDRPKNCPKRFGKQRAKKRKIARIRYGVAQGITDNPKGDFDPKVREILAIPPDGQARNQFIMQNTNIITLRPYKNVRQTMGVKCSEEWQDPLRVQHIIQVNLATENEKPLFVDRFVIKKSKLHRFGLYAGCSFKKGETLSVYGGDHHLDEGFRSEYYMYSEDKGYGLNGYSSKKGNPILHGMHLANDYHLGLILGETQNYGEYEKMKNSDKYNMVVDHNFVFIASRDIEEGEELYYHYGWSQDDNVEAVEVGNDDDDDDDDKSDEEYDYKNDDESDEIYEVDKGVRVI